MQSAGVRPPPAPARRPRELGIQPIERTFLLLVSQVVHHRCPEFAIVVGFGIVLRMTRIQAQQHNLRRLWVADERFGYGLNDDLLVDVMELVVFVNATYIGREDVGASTGKL
jgi:hypothetical protein